MLPRSLFNEHHDKGSNLLGSVTRICTGKTKLTSNSSQTPYFRKNIVKFENFKYICPPFLHPAHTFNMAFWVTENEDFLISGSQKHLDACHEERLISSKFKVTLTHVINLSWDR